MGGECSHFCRFKGDPLIYNILQKMLSPSDFKVELEDSVNLLKKKSGRVCSFESKYTNSSIFDQENPVFKWLTLLLSLQQIFSHRDVLVL